MLDVDEIRERLTHRKPAAVIEATGITKQTLWRFRKGRDPSYDTLVKLSAYLENTP